MRDEEKTKRQLIDELGGLRKRLATYEPVADSGGSERVADQLRQEQTRAQQYLDVAAVIMVVLNGEGKTTLLNQKGCEILGYPGGSLLGHNWFETCVPERLRSEVLAVFRQLMAGQIEPTEYYENPIVTRSGEERIIAWHNTLLTDEAGQLVGTLSSGMDITERRQVEEALRASEAKYRRLHQSMMDAFVSVTMDGRIQEYNEAYRKMLGYESEELLALCYTDITPEKWHAFEAEIVEKQILRRGFSETYEKEYRKKDGTIFPVELRTCLIGDDNGRPLTMWAIVRDITERKQAQEALKKAHDELERRVEERTAELAEANKQLAKELEERRRTEEQYRSLVDACPDSVVVSDLSGKILFASPQTWRLLGLPAGEELVGRGVLDYVIESDRGRLAANMPNVVDIGSRRNTEYTALRRDGTTVSAEASSVVMRDSEGRPKALMAVIRDITERKQAQEALEHERLTLQYMLRASDHERQVIAYDIHDGLAQHLAAAVLQFEAFDSLKANNPDRAGDALHAGMTLLRQGHYEARRVISGVRPPVLDESGVLAAIAHLIHEPKGSNGPVIELRSKVQFDRMEPVEENAIYRIVQEAVTNVCKHSQSKKAQVSLIQRGDRVRIEIRDWGIGFDPATVPEKRFGLTGIRERARLLGGKCRIRTRPGKGTSVAVDLPVVERKSE